MSTLAPVLLQEAAREIEKIYKSAVFSGIVGDRAHQARGGYHISVEDQPGNNYSVTRPDDKAPPGTWATNLAAALDMSMSTADLKLATSRFEAVWADRTDPRRKYFNAFNGYKGTGDAKRYDMVTNSVSTASPDHKWHKHDEWRRKYVNDRTALKAYVSIHKGETKQQWLDAQPKPKPPTPAGNQPGTRDLIYTAGKPLLAGDDVKFVQRWVRGDSSNAITVDGVYGPATKARVAYWQKNMRDRAATGRITKVDWKDMGVTIKY
jgi:hypothetical protein